MCELTDFMGDFIKDTEKFIKDNTRNVQKVKKNFYNINPECPSLVVNYNLTDAQVSIILKNMNELWPQLYRPLHIINYKKGSLVEKINELKKYGKFEDYSRIYIHILWNSSQKDIENVMDKISSELNDQVVYEFVLHAYIDMASIDYGDSLKHVESILNEKRIQLKMIYENMSSTGAILKDEIVFRLMSHVISLMIINIKVFQSDSKACTFSYQLLEKPIRELSETIIKCLLSDDCVRRYQMNYSETKDYRKKVKDNIINLIRDCKKEIKQYYSFNMNSFLYLPDNEQLKRIDDINTFKTNSQYVLSYECYTKLIDIKKSEINSDVKFKQLLNDAFEKSFSKWLNPLLGYIEINSYIKQGNKMNDILQEIKSEMTYDTTLASCKGLKLLCEDANNEILRHIQDKILEQLDTVLSELEIKAKNLDSIIKDSEERASKNITEGILYSYVDMINDFYKNDVNIFIRELNSIMNEKELLMANEEELLKNEKLRDIFIKKFKKIVQDFFIQHKDDYNSKMKEELSKMKDELMDRVKHIKEDKESNVLFYGRNDYKVELDKDILLTNEENDICLKELYIGYQSYDQDCMEYIGLYRVIDKIDDRSDINGM